MYVHVYHMAAISLRCCVALPTSIMMSETCFLRTFTRRVCSALPVSASWQSMQ